MSPPSIVKTSRAGHVRHLCLYFAAAALLLAGDGCSHHEEFALPRQSGGADVAFRWQPQANPVLARGGPGEWDSVDVLNPSIVRHAGLYYNFYSGFDGTTWHTGVASSSDGLHWTKMGKVLSPGSAPWEGKYIAANGSAIFTREEFLYWYQAGLPPSIGLARSRDALQWIRSAEPALRPGPRGSWDERGVADPYVIQVGGRYYMYFLGQDRARRQRLGVARSDDGSRWTKLLSNPVLELGEPGSFDENGLGEPAVWISQGRYWMLYTGRDRHEYRRLGIAWSQDGVEWTRLGPGTVIGGEQEWNSKVLCDPSVVVEGNLIRVWFGGGDVATPAERLNGQIGYAVLTPVGANLSK